MPRARSPDSVKAEALYHKGTKLADIAEKLGVPASTVRRWKHDQKWDSERSGSNRTKPNGKTKKPNARKAGAQPGNQNAKGKQNALKHGAYASLRWDFLDPEERELMNEIPQTPEDVLIESIMQYTIRERKIMKAIKKYEDARENGTPVALMQSTRTEEKRAFDGTPEEVAEQKALYKEMVDEKVADGKRLPGRPYTQQTTTENVDNLIARLQQELSTVQRAKDTASTNLAKIQIEKKKIEADSKANDVVDAWVKAIQKGGTDDAE